MKYKVGDKVRIKSLDWYKECMNDYGRIDCDYVPFIPDMSIYCGEILTICDINEQFSYYHMKECEYAFTDEMIEGLVEEESANYSKVIDNGVSNPIIAKTSSATIDTDKGFYSYSDSDDNLEMEWNLPEGYQFVDENGNVINATKIVLEKKKKEYPKTFEECVHVLEGENRMSLEQMNTFRKLIDARNAYWKIAGEEMGLGKPWEPDWDDDEWPDMYYISFDGKHIDKEKGYPCCNMILIFPTAEMRDAFYENFKEEIEQCKELL